MEGCRFWTRYRWWRICVSRSSAIYTLFEWVLTALEPLVALVSSWADS